MIFPYENIRPSQKQLLETIEKAINTKTHAILHAPTGLGKTAASITPAIEKTLERDLTVCFLTSRHTQHKIVLETLEKIKTKTNQKISSVSFIGKRAMCAQEGAEALPTRDFHEYCKNLREHNQCNYYLNARGTPNVICKALVEQLNQTSPHTVQKIITESKNAEVCPYETSLMMAENANLIITDYFYFINSKIRIPFLSKINKKIENCIIIIDEGHNLPTRARELLTKEINTRVIARAITESKKYFKEVTSSLNLISDNLITLARDTNERLITTEDFIKTIPNFEEITGNLAVAADTIREHQRQSSIGTIAEFLEDWQEGKEGFIRYTKKDTTIRLIKRCLDPSIALQDLEQSYCTIIMSGTLTPTHMYKDLLGFKKAITAEFPSPFPPKNRLALVVPKTTTKYSQRSTEQYQKIAAVIASITNIIPGCTAVFFPSYDIKNQVLNYYEEYSNKTIFQEHPSLSSEEKNTIIQKFTTYKNTGAVLLAAATGSFGEGIDLPGILKSVIVVGLPLDKPDLETNELIKYYDKRFGKGWDYGYTLPAITKILQNAGRCIRNETDKGTLIFVDERYAWPRYLQCFPKDWQIKVTNEYVPLIEEFFRNT